MLTQEQNDTLTLVGPGTPAGELLRRYWYPIAIAGELTDEQPTKFARLLGEDLVLFKDKSGRVGLLADHCSHRGASLLYGRVEERGISCAYHGWLYDCEGNILETPPERNDAIMNSVKHTAYPVQELVGLIWAYLGPAPAPVIPHYDIWVRTGGARRIEWHPVLDNNWLQTIENACDPTHAPILHQDAHSRRQKAKPVNTTRGFIDDQPGFEVWEVPYGLMKKRIFRNGEEDEHPLIFPNMLRVANNTHIMVPIDDTHTMRIDVIFLPAKEGVPYEEGGVTVRHLPPYKDPSDRSHPHARWTLETIAQQDHMAWETQGPIVDRSAEHLAHGDRGIVLLRRIMQENIELVRRGGGDPMAVVRDPDHPRIDTHWDRDLNSTGGATGAGRPYGLTTGTLVPREVPNIETAPARTGPA